MLYNSSRTPSHKHGQQKKLAYEVATNAQAPQEGVPPPPRAVPYDTQNHRAFKVR